MQSIHDRIVMIIIIAMAASLTSFLVAAVLASLVVLEPHQKKWLLARSECVFRQFTFRSNDNFCRKMSSAFSVRGFAVIILPPRL